VAIIHSLTLRTNDAVLHKAYVQLRMQPNITQAGTTQTHTNR